MKVWRFAITNIFLEKYKCAYVLSCVITCVCMVLNKVFLNCSLPYFKQFSLNLELVIWPIVADLPFSTTQTLGILECTTMSRFYVGADVCISVIFPDPLIIYFYEHFKDFCVALFFTGHPKDSKLLLFLFLQVGVKIRSLKWLSGD